MIARKAYHQPPFLLGFLGGMIAMLLLLATSPVSFQYYSHGHSESRSLSLNSGTYQVSINGFVPVICRVSVLGTPSTTGNGLINLGEMNEFCNNGRGYRVYIDHSSKASDAAVIVDGQRVPLSPEGSTMIYEASGPGKRTHQLSLDVSNSADSVGGLWFRIKPI